MTMASSLISSSHHIDFDSVFGMEDASLATVFESLITTGLKEFLGCSAIFYEAALTEFFANGSVRDGFVTVHRFVHINEQVGMEKTAVSPPMKKTPKKRAVSKKRPVDSDAEVAPIVKKKRTTKGKPATTGLEAVPLQTIESTTDVPDEQPSKPKRKSQKRKRRLVLDEVYETGESAAEQPAAGTATGVQETSADVPVATHRAVAPADDPYAIIEQILTQLDTAAATKGDDQPTAQAKESIPWFDLPFELARQDAEGFLSSDTDEEFIADQPTVPIFPDGGDQPQVSRNSKPVTEEHMSIDDLLMQIYEDMMLPSVTAAEITKIRLGESINILGVQEHDLFYDSLPRISIHDKGKEILVEDEPKAVIAQGISVDTESLAIRNKFNALDEKILLLDGQVTAIRSEQLEFQAKIAADLLSLSTQIGDLVDYIRGGDSKKGEGSSSRPQPPPSNVQGQGSGGNPGEGSGPSVFRLTDIADRVREDDRRQMEAERERERQRRIRRLSSGSHKRRRGH
ncbi:hypothetical protein F511_37532 [Dorcoceras hygrometricum]|uniref:Uncharacterized protein n=1 Tax=Dorcoceras hygrometricum TaxID=472368 RepID=A0A2Z7CX96_9LAMI|nr:hypothetical protein F511_37532 [Dorcoceras hygrometricum]